MEVRSKVLSSPILTMVRIRAGHSNGDIFHAYDLPHVKNLRCRAFRCRITGGLFQRAASRLHCLVQDWSPDDPAEVATSAAGSSAQVKLWDINSPQSPKVALDTGGDTMKVQYTPFGRGLVTSAVLKVRADSLLLWPGLGAPAACLLIRLARTPAVTGCRTAPDDAGASNCTKRALHLVSGQCCLRYGSVTCEIFRGTPV